MKNEEGKAYAEVNAILEQMEDKYVNKIPKKLRDLFKENAEEDYYPKIDPAKSLNEQNLQRETMVILGVLCLNYWCETEEEKQELLKAYSENEKKHQQELMEKYNPDNIFKNSANSNNNSEVAQDDSKSETTNDEKSLVEYKENIFKKFWNKIKSLFKK